MLQLTDLEMNLLHEYSIFENNEMIQYWLTTTGLSLFSNKYKSLLILFKF